MFRKVRGQTLDDDALLIEIIARALSKCPIAHRLGKTDGSEAHRVLGYQPFCFTAARQFDWRLFRSDANCAT
ncbi:hypothetical protein VXQ18_07580 [Brucella abortus]|nr:hypothetical protein [Brucella abortus]